MKHSISTQNFNWSPPTLLAAKSKKEPAMNVKLNKILVNLQPKAVKKPSMFEMTKSVNFSISQRSNLDNTNRSIKRKEPNLNRVSNNLSDVNISRNGSISMRQKVQTGHVRSISNGNSSHGIANIPVIEKKPEKPKRNISIDKEDKKIFPPQVKIIKTGDLMKGMKVMEKIEKMSNFSHRTLIKNPRHRSMADLKEGIQEFEKEMLLNAAEKDLRSYREQVIAIRTPLKTPKKEETFQWKNLMFGELFDKELIKKHVKSIIEGLNYAMNHLKAPSYSFIESRQIMLEQRTKFQKTLILDLDETLINSCPIEDGPDLILTPKAGSDVKIMIKVRPYVEEFLEMMKEHFEIVVFTASSELYAKTVVQALDPKEEYISHILHRDFCLETNRGIRIKDLRIIKNRNLKDLIIVDNFVPAFSFQLENGVPILEWRGDRTDQELIHIAKYLIAAKSADDLREYNKKNLKLMELVNSKWQSLVSYRGQAPP